MVEVEAVCACDLGPAIPLCFSQKEAYVLGEVTGTSPSPLELELVVLLSRAEPGMVGLLASGECMYFDLLAEYG